MNRILLGLIGILAICVGCRPEPTPSTATGVLAAQVRYEGTDYRTGLPIAPLMGARLTVKQGEQTIASDTTNRTGDVYLPNLPSGTYRVEVSYKKLPVRAFNTEVSANQTTVLKSDFFDCVYFPTSEVPKTRWTVIHYANLADIQIEDYTMCDLRMIEKHGGSDDSVHHIAYTPAAGNYLRQSNIMRLMKPSFDVADEQLYNNKVPTLFSPAYVFNNVTYADADPADYRLLERSIVEICRLFPSDSIMLAIYDHGTGIDIAWGDERSRSISGNFDTRKEITMPQLRQVLNRVKDQGYRVDALVFSACLMGAFEVGYELKDCGVSYIVAAEVPIMGLMHGAANWVQPFGRGEISGFEACRRIVAGAADPMALWDMKRFEELNVRFNNLADKIGSVDPAAIKAVLPKTARMAEMTENDLPTACYDLADFADQLILANFQDPQGVKLAAKEVSDFIKTQFVATMRNPSSHNYHGVGVLIKSLDPIQPYVGHNQRVYRQHRYYLDGHTAWDRFLMTLD